MMAHGDSGSSVRDGQAEGVHGQHPSDDTDSLLFPFLEPNLFDFLLKQVDEIWPRLFKQRTSVDETEVMLDLTVRVSSEVNREMCEA